MYDYVILDRNLRVSHLAPPASVFGCAMPIIQEPGMISPDAIPYANTKPDRTMEPGISIACFPQ